MQKNADVFLSAFFLYFVLKRLENHKMLRYNYPVYIFPHFASHTMVG